MTPRITAPELDALPGIVHGFFTRRGGVSAGQYDSLNCGIGSADDPALVAENRARVARSVGAPPAPLTTPYQIHSADVATVTEPWASDGRPKADGVVTDRPGIALGVGTADCGPVLLADGAAGVIGACHSGWRGAFTGILDQTLAAMEQLGARRERTIAVLGPTISVDSYEVDDGFRRTFEAGDAANAGYFRPGQRPGHHQFDLPAYIVARLKRCGAGQVRDLARCTYRENGEFFSYRRMCHLGEADYGRQLSVITLSGDRG